MTFPGPYTAVPDQVPTQFPTADLASFASSASMYPGASGQESANAAFSLATDLVCALQAHLALCEEALALVVQENQALQSLPNYHPREFGHKRKNLLPRLDQSLIALRRWRQCSQSLALAGQTSAAEVKSLFQAVQSILMKVLLLDRENQMLLLRHGLLPTRHLPSPSVQQPHCVNDLYRRHARC